MARFIELTKTDNTKILLNKEWIVEIKPYGDGSTMIHVGVPDFRGQKDNLTSYFQVMYVRETYNWLKDNLI